MTAAEPSAVPREARAYQGNAAGVATRLVAGIVDGLVVGAITVLGYLCYVAFRLFLDPRGFRLPDTSVPWCMTTFLAVLVVYLSASWWLSGRTYGDHVMGITVVGSRNRRLRLPRALARAVLCALFPIGLLWCAVSARRLSLQDLVLRTSVVYEWLPRPTVAAALPPSGPHQDPSLDEHADAEQDW